MKESYSFTGISNKTLEEVKHHMQSHRVLLTGVQAARGNDSLESLANQVVAMIEAMQSPQEHLSEGKIDNLTVPALRVLAEKHRVRIAPDCRRRADIIKFLHGKARRRDAARKSKNPDEMYSAYHT